ncbi:MAG TPA: energy transducer TonB [Flavobacterium sp.]|uniref:energy transducer TonB n=1 Tax=Flavobacterium sp. TaxID=239 RepID=UPI002ED3CC02
MDKQYKISIPEPCHENWDKMSPKDNGRFCLSCCKTVVDFTSMLPEEIQHFFIQNQGNKICGRFKKTQLDNIIIQIPSQILYSQNHYHKMFLLALFIAMGTTLFSCTDKNGDKKKIDKVEIVEDSPIQKDMVTDETRAIEKNDCTQNPAAPLKKISPKKAKIAYPIMITGDIVPTEIIDKSSDTLIDYEALFNTAYLDVLPTPEGGMDKFYSFLKTNYIVPDKTEKYIGKVYTSFVIEKDGTLSTFKIIRDAGPGTGEEAIRVLKMAPEWIPGKLNNHVVRTTYMLPISFSNK